MTELRQPFAFISYAHADSATVMPIIESIMASGRSVWYDKNINISATWTDEIAQAILDCDALVAFISREAIASQFVRAEIEFAIAKKKRVIPVYLDGIDILPPGLALGLNATQGVVGKKDAREIAEQICAGLAFGREDEEEAINKRAAAIGKALRSGDRRRFFGGGFARKTAIALAAVLAIAGVGFGGYKAYEAFSQNSGAYKLEIAKKRYYPAEKITVYAPNATKQMARDDASVGIFSPKFSTSTLHVVTATPSGKSGLIHLIAPIRPNEPSKLIAPTNPGEYELRAIESADYDRQQEPKSVVSFRVVPASGAFKTAIAPKAYKVGDMISVSVSGVPQALIDSGAVVAIYKVGEPSGRTGWIAYRPVRQSAYEFELAKAESAGEYEVRAFTSALIMNDSTLVASAKTTVE